MVKEKKNKKEDPEKKDKTEKSIQQIRAENRSLHSKNMQNSFKMDQFHRIVKENPKRHITDKKRIRDIERLLEKEGLPEEIRTKKTKELRDLKK